jgi:hypothetical protein
MHTMSHHHTGRLSFYLYIDSAHVRERELPKRPIHTSKEAYLCAKRGPQKKNGSRTYDRLSHHHTYYVTSSYILCHIIIHTMSHLAPVTGCHIIIHTMSHHHTYYVTSSYILCHISHLWQAVTSSYILCHIIIHTMSHHHTYYVTSRTCDRLAHRHLQV